MDSNLKHVYDLTLNDLSVHIILKRIILCLQIEIKTFETIIFLVAVTDPFSSPFWYIKLHPLFLIQSNPNRWNKVSSYIFLDGKMIT